MDKTDWLKFGSEAENKLKELQIIANRYGVTGCVTLTKNGIFLDASDKEDRQFNFELQVFDGTSKATIKDVTYIK